MKMLSCAPNPKRIKMRIMGSETEWGMRFCVPPQKDNKAFAEKTEILTRTFLRGNYAETFARATVSESPGRFRGPRAILLNQGQFYADFCGQTEYATPECLGAEQLALYETAGLDIACRAVRQFNDGYADILAPVKLYKTNRNTVFLYDGAEPTSLSWQSWGSHANYLTLRRRVDLRRNIERFWLPFLETRWCVIGNGWVDFFDGTSAHFLLSQRADCVDHRWRQSTTEEMKPLIHLRDEPHARPDVWRRLHDVSGNANMSHKQLFLKYATADITLAMIETENFLREPPHFTEKRHNARDVCRCFNADIFGRVRLACSDGKNRGFLDVQEFYIEEALRFFREGRATLTDERKRALDMWQSVIDAMRRRDLRYLARFLDWAAILRQCEFLFAKLNLDFDAFCGIEETGGFIRYPAGRRVAWDAPVPRRNGPDAKLLPYLLELITQYADVETERSPYGVLTARGAMDVLFTPAQIAHAAGNPPERTRARLRATIEEAIRPPSHLQHTAWDTETVAVQGTQSVFFVRHIPLLNPYQFRIGAGEKLLLGQE